MLRITGERTIDEYLDALNTSTTIYIDKQRLENAVVQCRHLSRDYEWLCLLEMNTDCPGCYSRLSKENIVDYLENMGVTFDKRYTSRGGTPSLDMAKVIDPLIEKGKAVEMLTIYKQYRSVSSWLSNLNSLLDAEDDVCMNEDGRPIAIYHTTLSQRDNLRVYTSNINVQGIPREYSNIVTSPSTDYHLAWCDYPQADWRFAYNLFIRGDDNFDIMRRCTDAYEGLARLVEGDSFDPEKFKERRKEYKVNCLKTFYGSNVNKPVPNAMRKYFMSRPKYKLFVDTLDELWRLHMPVPITSYFGYEQSLPEGKYPSAFVSKGLNTPIQTLTSHVVNETVLTLLERFWERGYTKDDINIYYTRHDEAIFRFKDTILPDAWIFKDCSQIHIDGFTPIDLEFHFGNYYKEEDEALTTTISELMNAHDDMLHTYPAGEIHEYFPVPTIKRVFLKLFSFEDKPGYLYYWYDYETGEFYKDYDPDPDVRVGIVNVLERGILKAIDEPDDVLIQTGDHIEWLGTATASDGRQVLLKTHLKDDSELVVAMRGKEQE